MARARSPERPATGHQAQQSTSDAKLAEQMHDAIESLDEAFEAISHAGLPLREFALKHKDVLVDLLPKMAHRQELKDLLMLVFAVQHPSPEITAIASMLQSVEALGPALSGVPAETSPQLARSLQATENTWRRMDHEFGLLSSLEVSRRVGSRRPNRSYASDQHSKGRLIAIKRPGGLHYPGFQINPHEQQIRPVMEELIRIAREAEVSESSLALWMCSPTGYLDNARPVDRLDQPGEVIEAAGRAFNVEW